MPIVRMVQTAVDQIVGMVAVRDGLVTATGTMNVGAGLPIGAAIRVLGADCDHVLVDVIAMRVMQVAVVQVIDVSIVTNGSVAAARAMLVGVIGMNLVVVQRSSPAG